MPSVDDNRKRQSAVVGGLGEVREMHLPAKGWSAHALTIYTTR